MLLSRFFYIVLAAALAGALFLLYLATAVTNRTSTKTAERLLTSAGSAVNWYLTDDSRRRAASLVGLTVNSEVSKALQEANGKEDIKELKAETRQGVKDRLAKFRQTMSGKGLVFDALWAIDVHGRVIASENFERGTGSEHFEMGGYSIVADAIHGWIRDDAWVFDGQIYRVVAHPVEVQVGGAPVGAIVAAKIVDAAFAQDISDRTNAAVAFYAGGTRVATGAPQDFDKALLEVHAQDLEKAKTDPNYDDKGKTTPMILRENAGHDVMVMFNRLHGDAWDLGAGYVVGHRQSKVRTPFEYQSIADQNDKDSVPIWLLALVVAAGALIGLILSVFEHTLPLGRFRRAVADLANKKTDTDVLKPSTFRGVFKGIARDINDSLDKVAAKAGIDRGPADLESVLGPLPAQPQMSAFSVPKSGAAPLSGGAASGPGSAAASGKSLPKPKRSLPKARASDAGDDDPVSERDTSSSGMDDDAPVSSSASSGLPDAAAFGAALRGESPAPSSTRDTSPRDEEDDDNAPTKVAALPKHLIPDKLPDQKEDAVDEETEWRKVYADFVSMKKKFGEPTEKLTYEKFRGTLMRNREALVSRHNCARVKFRVYEKQGRAALKASPVK